jgi:hypothetical protein
LAKINAPEKFHSDTAKTSDMHVPRRINLLVDVAKLSTGDTHLLWTAF